MSRNSTPATLVNIDDQTTGVLREQLIRDITRLERLLEQLRRGDNSRDYSLQQTYREMIYSRKEMLTQLPHRHQA